MENLKEYLKKLENKTKFLTSNFKVCKVCIHIEDCLPFLCTKINLSLIDMLNIITSNKDIIMPNLHINEELEKYREHYCLMFDHMLDNCPNDVKTHNFECSGYLYDKCKMHDKNTGGC